MAELKLEIGFPARIVKDNYGHGLTGRRGIITDEWGSDIGWRIMLDDGESYDMDPDELAPIQQTVVEGPLVAGYDKADGQYFVTLNGENLWAKLHPLTGKRIRLIIEELPEDSSAAKEASPK